MDCIGYRFLHVAAVNSISSSQYQLSLHPQALLRKSITQANFKSTLLHTIYIVIYIYISFFISVKLHHCQNFAANADRRLRFQRLALSHCCNSANKYLPSHFFFTETGIPINIMATDDLSPFPSPPLTIHQLS